MTKRMQRMLSIILVLSIMIACFVSPVTAEENNGAVSDSLMNLSEQCAKKLLAFGIFDENTEKNIVTRSGFVTHMLKFMNCKIVGSKDAVSVFNDVETNIDDINYAKGLGIISGTNGNFYPEQKITGTDAAVMLIKSLGYAVVADQTKGGYPSGYIELAGELQLFSGAEVTDMNKPLSYEQIAVIFLNALNANTMYMKTYGNYEKAKDTTALNYYHNIFHTKDIVNANNKTNLIGAEILSDNNVMIGDIIYDAGQSGAEDYLGCKVDYYYFDDGKTDMPVVKYVQQSKSTKVLLIDANDVEGLDNANKLKYYDDNRSKSIDIQSNLQVVFNNVPSIEIQSEDFKPESGYLKFVDNDGNGRYDILFIQSYRTVVVSSVFNDREQVRDYITGDIVEFQKYNRCEMTAKGIKIDVSGLKKWDVLSIAESKDKKYAEILIGNDKVSGKIEKVTEDIIKIGGEEYQISECMQNLIRDGRIKLKVGEVVTVCLDFQARAAVISNTELSGRVGVILRLIEDYQGETCEVRILDREDGEMTLSMAKKVTINGERCKNIDIVTKMRAVMAQTYFDVVPMVYDINAAGQVVKLETPGGQNLKELCSNEEYYYVCGANTFLKDRRDGSFFAGSSTCFCYVPENSRDIEKYKIRTLQNITSDIDQKISAFAIGNSRIADIVLIKSGTGSSNVGGGEALAVVTDKYEAWWDEDEDVVIGALDVYKNGSEAQVPLRHEEDNDRIDMGDIIFYRVDEDGDVKFISEVYKAGETGIFSSSATERGRVAGKVYYKEGSVIGLVANESRPDQIIYCNLFSPPNIYVYDSERKEVTLGTIDDIIDYESAGNEASTVFVQTNYTRVLNVVVYK